MRVLAATEETVTAPADRSHYRAYLDGVRALAVYLVVAFHAGVGRFDGGFIGVDVFFVLSGYLVTQLLLRDLHRTGRIRFGRFYSRRFRRLLPAAFVTLIVTSVVYSAIASPAEVIDALRAVRAAFLYVANWFFIRESADYFAANINTNPVVHFWSLAIEEQFYLVWPVLLSGLFLLTRRAGRHQWTYLRAAVAVAGVVSLVTALRISGSDLSRAYYGTDTRAYQLLAGALLALTPQLFADNARVRRAGAWIAPLAVAAIVFVASAFVHLQPIQRGVFATVAAAALIFALECAPTSGAGRVLSVPPVVYLGRVSYGTYLWHWPVIVVATTVFTISPGPLFFMAALLATGLASLSFQILERPIRQSPWLDRYRAPVIAVGLATSVVAATVIVPHIFDRSTGSDVAVAEGTAVSGATLVPKDLDWKGAKNDTPNFPSCLGEAPEHCVVVRGNGPHIMLMGDSHARMFVPAFTKLAKQHDLTFSTAITPACPWQDGVEIKLLGETGCAKDRADWLDRVVPALDPDIIVASHRPYDDPAEEPLTMSGPDGVVKSDTNQFMAMIRAATSQTVQHLEDGHRKIVMLEPIPVASPSDDPLACLSKAKYLDECRYVANTAPTPEEKMERDVAANDDNVWSLDLDKLACPYLPICDPIVDGRIVKRDTLHLTSHYAETLADRLWDVLSSNKIVP
jgi:peptidoglycan/LPS O-acetylase OafA/YrhL